MEQAQQLRSILQKSENSFKSLTEQQWSAKPSPTVWSKKEILGHLIDSAMNNLRRFVVTQYQQNDTIFYHQNEWVNSQDYQGKDTQEIIALWKAINLHLAHVMEHVPADKMSYTCNTGKTEKTLYTLEYLMKDYIVHLNHHLQQLQTR